MGAKAYDRIVGSLNGGGWTACAIDADHSMYPSFGAFAPSRWPAMPGGGRFSTRMARRAARRGAREQSPTMSLIPAWRKWNVTARLVG